MPSERMLVTMSGHDEHHESKPRRHGWLLILSIFAFQAIAAAAILLTGEPPRRSTTGNVKVDRLINQAHRTLDPDTLYPFQQWLAQRREP